MVACTVYKNMLNTPITPELRMTPGPSSSLHLLLGRLALRSTLGRQHSELQLVYSYHGHAIRSRLRQRLLMYLYVCYMLSHAMNISTLTYNTIVGKQRTNNRYRAEVEIV